ncbi:MAG: YdcH family protein [Arenicellales bacterium]|nr:YdcH family protein [Arenicellales bacterium]
MELFDTLTNRISELKSEHRALDGQLDALAADPNIDDLQVRRLKKRKLFLKDSIAHLEKQLIPDATA